MRNILKPDAVRYDGVRPINIYLLRLVYGLIAIVLGAEIWTKILTHDDPWDHVKAVAFCVWAAYSVLSVLGLFHPLKLIPILLLEIVYKGIWLILIAYPLWRSDTLVGSPAEEMTYSFLWVGLVILAVPWGFVWRTYLTRGREIKKEAVSG